MYVLERAHGPRAVNRGMLRATGWLSQCPGSALGTGILKFKDLWWCHQRASQDAGFPVLKTSHVLVSCPQHSATGQIGVQEEMSAGGISEHPAFQGEEAGRGLQAPALQNPAQSKLCTPSFPGVASCASLTPSWISKFCLCYFNTSCPGQMLSDAPFPPPPQQTHTHKVLLSKQTTGLPCSYLLPKPSAY